MDAGSTRPTSSATRCGPSHEVRDLSRASIEELVKAFEGCTLPRDEWTHDAHLVIGLWYVLHFGPERAFTQVSAGIQRYNAASGRTDAERNGYDARATREWVERIADFARLHTGDTLEGTIFRRLLASPLAERSASAEKRPPPPVPPPRRDKEVTRLLRLGARGDNVVHDLFDLVYDELCAIAGQRMKAERADHMLQATALVHEAYARLLKDQKLEWTSRRQFFGAAAQAMRRILVDHARYVHAERRADHGVRMSLTAVELTGNEDPARVVALDDVLEQLADHDPRAAEVVHLRFFAGMSIEETAEAMELSVRTVSRDWTYARAWLLDKLA